MYLRLTLYSIVLIIKSSLSISGQFQRNFVGPGELAVEREFPPWGCLEPHSRLLNPGFASRIIPEGFL